MKYRLLTIDDYDEILKLWNETPGIGVRKGDDDRDGIERFLNRNPSTCFAAVDNDKIIGTILAGNDGRRGYIYHMVVHTDYRKCGIGADLVEYACEALRREGICKAALMVFTDNKAGNAFWDKMGFVVRDDLYYRNKML
nr:GNAT family N-acetyltransferase [Clostridia bacterium]